MLRVDNIDIWGFEHAVRGMRNPMNSWDRSDSEFTARYYVIGDNDLVLMKKLYKAGTEHRKYLRQIFVSFDITAPLYWWTEFDTYKVGTTANSCSKMHTLHHRDLNINDFSTEHLFAAQRRELQHTIDVINACRRKFVESNSKEWWWQMIQLLPQSFNQRRTVTLNYENVVSIMKQRKGHKLDEWNWFIKALEDLPYIKEITEE